MSYLKCLHPVLEALDDGRIIRRGVAMAQQVIAVVAVLAGALGMITVLKFALSPGTSVENTVGGMVYAAIWAAMTMAVFQVFRYRAAHVAQLGDSPFTVMPIVSILCRCLGEVHATVLVGFGVGAFVLALFASDAASFLMGQLNVLPGMPSRAFGAGLLGGLIALVLFAILAFGSLVLFYFFAVFTDLSTAVERSEIASGLEPIEWGERLPTSVSGAAFLHLACRGRGGARL
jgi:hypothetical protein